MHVATVHETSKVCSLYVWRTFANHWRVPKPDWHIKNSSTVEPALMATSQRFLLALIHHA